MKKIIFLSSSLLLINILVLTGITLLLSHLVEKRNFKNWQNESNLLFLKNDSHYNLVFMGISHARNLSRHDNHRRVEKILRKKICNIAQGWDYDGVHTQYLYLKYFYDLGNTTDTVVFFASPVMFYSNYLDNNAEAYSGEPFKFDFFRLIVKEGGDNKWQQLFYYARSKFSTYWLQTLPATTDTVNNAFLTTIDTAVVTSGLKFAYRDGMTETIFKKKCNDLKNIVALAQAHHSKVIFILPPAVFGKWPGTQSVVDFLNQLQPVYHTTCYDFSESVKNPSMYYDHHHLNTKGVIYFTQNYLKPVLGN